MRGSAIVLNISTAVIQSLEDNHSRADDSVREHDCECDIYSTVLKAFY